MRPTYHPMQIAFMRRVLTTDHGQEWPIGNPYGSVSWTGNNGKQKQVRAHRVAWILANGPIPEGYEIDHLSACPKTCVTVEHLQLLTKSEHTALGWERGELSGGWGTARQRIRPPRPEAFIWQTERTCPRCSTVFIPATSKKIYCSNVCMTKTKEERRNLVRYSKQGFIECFWCQLDFEPQRSDKIYCSRTCAYNANNFKKSQAKLEERGGEDVLFAKTPCLQCKELFSPTNRTSAGRQKFCSPACGMKYRDARRVKN